MMNETWRFCYVPLSSARTAHRTGNVTQKNSDVGSETPPDGQRTRSDACASGRALRRRFGSSSSSSTMKLSQTATEPPVSQSTAQLQPKTQPDRGRFRARAATAAHRAIVLYHGRAREQACTPYKPTRARTRNRLTGATTASFRGFINLY